MKITAVLFAFIFSFSVFAEESVTCKAFRDDATKHGALTSTADLDKDLQAAQLVVIAETHGDSNFKIIQPWMQETLKNNSFDCLFLELPSDMSTDANFQYQGAVENHPFLAKKSGSTPGQTEWLEYLHSLIQTSHDKGIKIFHVDVPQAELPTSDVMYDAQHRNDVMAANMAKLFASHTCTKGLAEFGVGHLASKIYTDEMFSGAKFTPIQSVEALKDVSVTSVAISNAFLDYVGTDFITSCFGETAGRFVKTSLLKNNMPYSQELGKINDFSYILVPN